MNDKSELLKYAIENGIIDLNTIQAEVEMNERKKYLEMHEHKIWLASDGYWKTFLPDSEKGRRVVKRKTKEEITEAVCDFYKSLENEPTIEQVFNSWLDDKLLYGEIRKQSYDRYKTDFDRFFINNKSFKNFGKRKLKYLDEEDLERFIRLTIADMELTQKAYSGLRTIVNGIFRYAKKKRFTNISITEFMGDLDISRKAFKKTVKYKEDEVYQEYEAEKLTEYLASQTNDIRCLGLLLIFQTGLRIGELCGLKPEDLSTKFIHITRSEVKYKDEEGKWQMDVQAFPKSEAGDRFVIRTDAADKTIECILNARSDGEYLFCENGKRLRSNSFRRKLERVCAKLGIKYKSNHKIRKTYGTMLIDGNVDDAVVAEQMGHVDISTTRKYYYFSNKGEDKKIEQIQKAYIFN